MAAPARTDTTVPDRSVVQIRTPGQPSLAVMDGRTPRFTPEQVEKAQEELERASGPVVATVRDRSEQSWELIRADLNRVAGGEASPRVMVVAQHALMAHEALVLQRLAAGKAFGTGDDLAEKHMRNAAGLAVVATDALNKAYEIAREEGKAARGNGPVGQLMTRLGVPAAAGPGPVPDLTGGGGSAGGPLSPNPSSPDPTSSKKDGK